MNAEENDAPTRGANDVAPQTEATPASDVTTAGMNDEPDEVSTSDTTRPGRVRRVLIGLGVVLVVLSLLVAGGSWYLVNRYAGNIDRIADVFRGLDEGSRPAPPTPAQEAAEEPLTFLLVGSDTRISAEQGEDPGGRSDTIMIARFTGDRKNAQLISIPRDSWVDIPGHGMNKINAAYAFGGPTLLIQTIEQATQVRIDHYMAIDFDGLIQMTDDLGGVDVVVAETTSNGPYTFEAGTNHLDGDQARWYLAQRYGLPGGDFDRVKRQQQYLRAMFIQLFESSTFTDPGRLDRTLRAVTDAVSVDDTLSNSDLVRLAFSLRNVRPESIDFFTAPVLGTGMEGPASVVYLDGATGERMWNYLRNDSLGRNAAEFGAEALPDIPR
ncbi:LCP family protein [Blastococcus sp. CCUG 61487]|uniref:LCP family protein n=1 Tax=Blastococcus sp. CCUG 61487 TaxID=1840703 RepID=UPI001133FB7C|nr:LCP family protein [Blastococcus sp. CCUG 61487]TKJ33016.1 hypothetical protein A6V29_16345 [Blastococcus sp. CCUG 61487]